MCFVALDQDNSDEADDEPQEDLGLGIFSYHHQSLQDVESPQDLLQCGK